MKQELTLKQKKLLSIIYNYIQTSGFPPTFEEMKAELNVVSNQSVIDHLKALERKRIIKRSEAVARGIKILKSGFDILKKPALMPFVGTSSAGTGLEDFEIEGEWQEVSKEVAKFKDDVFLVKISGDSMIGAGINDGDVVLVKEQKEFSSGDIVLARNNGETTVKRFISGDTPPFVYLKPENPKYKNIPFTEEMEMVGKVIKTIPIKNSNGKIITKLQRSSVTKKKKTSKPYFENEDKEILIFKDDILKIESIPESSVDLIITSPPYNVDIHYNSNKDDLSYQEYLEFTEKWLAKCYKLARDDGRFCLNIPLDKNKGGQQPVCADITNIAKRVGWNYHSTIIWNEGNISRRTAWGSWMSASAPYVIAPVEVILVLYKKDWKKNNGRKNNDITKQEFMDWTNGVWTFPGQSKKGAGGHPAPFPIELPRRCIKLFSFVDDTVLDPFLGSGSTLIASCLNNRKGIGVDIDKDYCDIAIKRLYQEAKISQLSLIK